MGKHKNHLDRVYGLDSQEATDAFYSDWAATYDAEVIANGYQTPARAAAALAKNADLATKILDIGCGTGYSGYHFSQAGFTNIIGTDPNAEMLRIAAERGIYTQTWLTDLFDPFPFEQGAYGVIAAIGVIGTGAAPASVLADVIAKLSTGGKVIFSFNDHALEEPEFPAARDALLEGGSVKELYREYGDHLTAQGLKSDVYIFEKL